MRKLRSATIKQERSLPGRSLLLFLTDRCPVGCAHCSVDSRRDSPTIVDYQLFGELVDGICADPAQVVGISGGEPFVERRGLTLAVHRLHEAGKDVCVYTSGVWARDGEQPAWIRDVLARASAVFLSTDGFHTRAVSEERFVAAARAIGAAATPVIVQVLDRADEIALARRLLTTAFGTGWQDFADLSPVTPLPYGRGAALFERAAAQPAETVGACEVLAAPVVRYDGRISACCNEAVVVGRGPARLRPTAAGADELVATLAAIRADALLGAIGTVGAGVVTSLPGYAQLAGQSVRGICDLCWRLQEASAVPLGDRSDRLLTLLPLVRVGQSSTPPEGERDELPERTAA